MFPSLKKTGLVKGKNIQKCLILSDGKKIVTCLMIMEKIRGVLDSTGFKRSLFTVAITFNKANTFFSLRF